MRDKTLVELMLRLDKVKIGMKTVVNVNGKLSVV